MAQWVQSWGSAQQKICEPMRLLRAAAEAHLLDVTRKQLELSRMLPEDTRRRRLISYLQRRGHTWDTISKLLQQTELSQH